MSPKSWYHKGLRFECTQCGNCCRNHGDYAFVYLAAADVEAMSAELKLSTTDFYEQYCKEDGGYTILRMDDPQCPFLQEDNRCTVYKARPKQCRTWPFWEENLKQKAWEGPVKECCPGIGEGELIPASEAKRIADETEAWYEDD